MARLTALPSIDTIRGFKGVLDFYLWKGLPCVRRWPHMTKAQMSQGSIDAGLIFGQVSANWRLLAPLALEAYQLEAKDQPRTARDLYISGAYGHLHLVIEEPPPPPPEDEMYDAYICLRDLKAQGAQGGTFTSGAWQTRDLNHEQADTLDICALAANQFTLPAASYRCLISCPCYRVDTHQARLWNVTDSAVLVLGTSAYSFSSDYTIARCLIAGRFTLTAQKTLRVEHRCATTKATTGFGVAANLAQEVYTLVELWRELVP